MADLEKENPGDIAAKLEWFTDVQNIDLNFLDRLPAREKGNVAQQILDKMAEYGRSFIMYDQLGCGLTATPSRPDLWKAETWIEELLALRKH